ncbi:hypothetical protein, partial [Bradyrhizobium sp.]|uniref:hypothetical protein n=1 Tax=Bradyrhizobium sp. TaxID=376 RepID=UPI003C457337
HLGRAIGLEPGASIAPKFFQIGHGVSLFGRVGSTLARVWRISICLARRAAVRLVESRHGPGVENERGNRDAAKIAFA